MALQDPLERTARGSCLQRTLTGSSDAPKRTLLQRSWRDYVFAEIWTRPGLDRRARYLVAIASAAASNGPARALDNYVRGALGNGDLTVAELREAALHLAVYAGWSRGEELDEAVSRIAYELELPAADSPEIRAEPWDAEERIQQGIAEFDAVMGFPGPPPVTPYFEA
ncbi:carboxymuconolactone decarboxylase family protein, partial [bacterium]